MDYVCEEMGRVIEKTVTAYRHTGLGLYFPPLHFLHAPFFAFPPHATCCGLEQMRRRALKPSVLFVKKGFSHPTSIVTLFIPF